MKLYHILENENPKFYVFRAFSCVFFVSPLMMLSFIALTVINSLSATVNASLLYTTLDSMSVMTESNEDFTFMAWAVVLLAAAMIVFPLIDSLLNLIKTRILQKVSCNIRACMMEKMSKIEYEYFEDKDLYDLTTRTLTETETKLTDTVFHTLRFVSVTISAIGLSVIVASIAWWMLPLSIVGAIPMLLVKFKKSDELNKAEKEMVFFNRVAAYISNLILNKSSMKEIKLFHLIEYLKEIWRSNSEKSFRRTLKVQAKYGKQGALINMLYVWVGTPVTFVNVIFVIQGKLTLADYLVLLNTVGTLGLLLVHDIPNSAGEVRRSKLFWNDLSVLWNFKDAAYTNNLEIQDLEEYDVVFDDVYFRYPKCETDILKGVSFTIRNGEKVAVVGENGAGKSTIIKLLLGLYKPYKGSVTINGCNVYEICPEKRKEIMSCIFQDFTKYYLSVKENIGFGDIDHINDADKIKEAAAKGLIDQYIEQMPAKYDTMLGNIYEEGTDISEGQWQKLNIAKAYNMDTSIIILDEPTASLDPLAEADIYTSFKNLSEHKTCLLVSHRLGSAQIGERILVVHNGQIVEDGSHEKLMEYKGRYAAMFEAQSKWYQGV